MYVYHAQAGDASSSEFYGRLIEDAASSMGVGAQVFMYFICWEGGREDERRFSLVSCRVLQRVMQRVLQFVLQCLLCDALLHTATHCIALQHNATICNAFIAAQCNTLQCTAAHCNTEPHTHVQMSASTASKSTQSIFRFQPPNNCY